jgi:hypothetical protein
LNPSLRPGLTVPRRRRGGCPTAMHVCSCVRARTRVVCMHVHGWDALLADALCVCARARLHALLPPWQALPLKHVEAVEPALAKMRKVQLCLHARMRYSNMDTFNVASSTALSTVICAFWAWAAAETLSLPRAAAGWRLRAKGMTLRVRGGSLCGSFHSRQ